MSQQPPIGNPAPEFTLPVAGGGSVSLRQFRGQRNVILYFYPRDNTPGCTREACDFRDSAQAVADHDAVVLGVSPDSTDSHAKFAARFGLPFQLLSDANHAVAEKYGVWVEKNMYGRKTRGIQRATFLIDKRGNIAAAWPKVRVAGHVEEVLQRLKELS